MEKLKFTRISESEFNNIIMVTYGIPHSVRVANGWYAPHQAVYYHLVGRPFTQADIDDIEFVRDNPSWDCQIPAGDFLQDMIYWRILLPGNYIISIRDD